MSARRRIGLAAASVALGLLVSGAAFASHVNAIVVDGSINPASSDYIQKAIAQSEQDGAAVLLIQLDTPGGLLASTKDIIQAMLNAEVPVVVYVSPQGAWAASAGTFITLAAHVAAMAPGTSIGAASPISASGSGGERDEKNERRDVAAEKAEKFTMAFMESIARERKRNVEWAVRAVREAEAIPQDEALEIGVIDLVASNRADLMAQIQGREVVVAGEPVTIDVEGAEIRPIEMTTMTRIFNFLASPDIAMLLVMAGLLGLYIEFNQPGMIVPGLFGLGCLVLAGIAFQILPFSWVGLMLVLLGVGLIVAELFITSYGVLFAAGLACFLLGGTMLFEVPEVSDLTISFWQVLVPLVVVFGIVAGFVLILVGRTFTLAQTAGLDELLGLVGRTASPLSPDGRVFVRGEYWTARADEEIGEGERVEVTAVDGMLLRVRRAPAER